MDDGYECEVSSLECSKRGGQRMNLMGLKVILQRLKSAFKGWRLKKNQRTSENIHVGTFLGRVTNAGQVTICTEIVQRECKTDGSLQGTRETSVHHTSRS